jgi:hypothetical protein
MTYISGDHLRLDKRIKLTRKSRKGGATSGAMHPTAEAHAVIADELVKAMVKLLAPPAANN